jgi:transcriptional regulator with XRE-family HTH domain
MSKLQDRRKAAGFSQSQLAARVEGLSLRSLQHYERGAMDINKAAALIVWRIAVALGCEVVDILEID